MKLRGYTINGIRCFVNEHQIKEFGSIEAAAAAITPTKPPKPAPEKVIGKTRGEQPGEL